MNKISQKDRNLLMIVIGIVILALAYVLGFSKLQTATEDMNNRNAQLDSSISRLQELKEKQSFYEEETAKYEIENAEIKSQYPSDILVADKILFVNKVEEAYEMRISSLMMQPSVNVGATYPSAELIDGDGAPYTADANPNAIYMYAHPLTISYEMGYTDFKRFVKYMVEDSTPKSIENVSVAFNELSGILSGSIEATMYSLTGTDVMYSRPDFTGISTGTGNIFGTFEKVSKVNDVEDSEENAE